MASTSVTRLRNGASVLARAGGPSSSSIIVAPRAPWHRRPYATEAAASTGTPISFTLSEDQLAYQTLARDFTRREVVPHAAAYDRSMEYPTEIIEKAWHAGLVNTHIPEQFGGAGLGLLEASLISEELAFGCTGVQTVGPAKLLRGSVCFDGPARRAWWVCAP